jgi:hypothetical protein
MRATQSKDPEALQLTKIVQPFSTTEKKLTLIRTQYPSF